MAEKSITGEILPEKTRRARDPATIIAISIVAFAIANLLHEGAGHGGACVVTGGHAKVLSKLSDFGKNGRESKPSRLKRSR